MKTLTILSLCIGCSLTSWASEGRLGPDMAATIEQFSPDKTISATERDWTKLYRSSCNSEKDEPNVIWCRQNHDVPNGIEEVEMRIDQSGESERHIAFKLKPGALNIDQESTIIEKFPFQKGIRTDQRPHLNMTQTDVLYEPKPGQSYRGQYQFNFNNDGSIRSIVSFWSNYVCAQ